MLTDEKPSTDQDVEPVIVDFARKLKRKSVPLLKVGIQFVQIEMIQRRLHISNRLIMRSKHDISWIET